MNTKHGHSKKGKVSREYSTWLAMRSRCLSLKDFRYPSYGGRGIKICARWEKFYNFLEDMGKKPVKKSLDRINNDGDYCKKNCRWATPYEQSVNRRNNVLVAFRGEKMTISEWGKKLGINRKTIGKRLQNKWTIKRALTKSRKYEKRKNLHNR